MFTNLVKVLKHNNLGTQTPFESKRTSNASDTLKLVTEKNQRLQKKYEASKSELYNLKIKFEFCESVKEKYRKLYKDCYSLIHKAKKVNEVAT